MADLTPSAAIGKVIGSGMILRKSPREIADDLLTSPAFHRLLNQARADERERIVSIVWDELGGHGDTAPPVEDVRLAERITDRIERGGDG